MTKRCRHLGCLLVGIASCECFGSSRVVRPPAYVVWATPAHPEKPWAVGREITGLLEGHRLRRIKAVGGHAGEEA